MKTTTGRTDGRTLTESENYRVVGDVLVVNKGDYLVNDQFKIQGDQLDVTTSKGRASLKRL